MGKHKPDSLVFCKHEGNPISPNYFSILWGRVISRNPQLPQVTFHALRHSHASALIAAGIDVVKVSRRLGHSSPVITLSTYAHLFAKDDDAAAPMPSKRCLANQKLVPELVPERGGQRVTRDYQHNRLLSEIRTNKVFQGYTETSDHHCHTPFELVC
jgi:hypothetical protein